MKRHLIFIIITFFVYTSSFGQRIVDGIELKRGRGVHFVFNTISEVENGKSLGSVGISHTELMVHFDTIEGQVPNLIGWELVAYSTSGGLSGDFGSPDLPLSKVVLKPSISQGTAILTGNEILSGNPNNVIARGNIGEGTAVSGGVEWYLSIYYECAKNVPIGLKGVSPDYYYTELIFEIRPVYA